MDWKYVLSLFFIVTLSSCRSLNPEIESTSELYSEAEILDYRKVLHDAYDSGKGIVDTNELWRMTLNYYLSLDKENDLFWDCEDDMEEVFRAWFVFLAEKHRGRKLTKPYPKEIDADNSAIRHLFLGAFGQTFANSGRELQLAWEWFNRNGSQFDARERDSIGDNAYAFFGAKFADYFDTRFESECRCRVKLFTDKKIELFDIFPAEFGPITANNSYDDEERQRQQVQADLWLKTAESHLDQLIGSSCKYIVPSMM